MRRERAAVLDLGSNSFHVLVADLDGRTLVPVLREREMLHLGRAVARHGEVPADDRDRAVDTAAHLAELARRAGVAEPIAVATAALRDAANGREVIRALSQAAGVDVRVLDGDEEARLGYLGARASVAVDDEPVGVLDLGGGSMELSVGDRTGVSWSASARIGASRLSAHVADDPLTRDDVKAIVARVDEELDAVLATSGHVVPATTVSIGGTVRALARIIAAQRAIWLPATLNQLRVSRRELKDVRDELVALDLDGRGAVVGMKSRRADHLHVAAVVLVHALERLGVDEVVVSDWGLREGLLLDAHGMVTIPGATQLRATEIDRLRRAFAPDDPHPVHVAALAGQLFDGTRELHGLSDLDRELLVHAAAVHTIGEALALRRKHEHAAYLVTNAELRGFDPGDAAILVTLVRFAPSRGVGRRYPAYASLPAADQDRAQRLLALLQVADALDRAHDQAVTAVHARREDDEVRLELEGRGLHVTPAELARRTRLFSQTFGVGVEIADLGRPVAPPTELSA